MSDFDCCARQGGHDVPDPSARALASALTRVRVETAAKSDAQSALAAVRREVAELQAVIEAAEEEKRTAQWIASQAVIQRTEADNRLLNMREDRDSLLAMLNDRDDAPLWRRIARQRLELARLNRLIYRHSRDVSQLRIWFRERIAADGGQARRELAQFKAAVEVRGTGTPNGEN